jgi:hypothetical protein
MGCEPVVCSWPSLLLPGCAASTECATRRRMIEWSERSTCGPSQRVAEAGSSPALEAQGLGGSSSDDDGTGRHCQTARARQARRDGVAEANQWLNPLKRGIGSNLADLGRAAVHVRPSDRAGDSGVGISWPARRPWGRSAAFPWRGCRGKAGRQPRRSIADERGNHPGAARGLRAGSLSAVGPGMGRSLRSSWRSGEPATGRREAAGLQRPSGRRGGRR